MVNDENVDEKSTQEDIDTSEENNDGQNQTNEELQSAIAKKKHWREKYENAQKELEELKKTDSKKPKDEPSKGESKSNEAQKALENSQKALLNSLGFQMNEQQEYILGEAERLQKDISEVVNDSYHQSKLKDIKDQKKLEDGMPKGRGSSGSNTKSDVDYYIKKGTMPKDQEMAAKVVNAKMKGDASNNKFEDLE